MTDADVHRAKPGYVYSVASHHSKMVPIPDKPGWSHPGPADYYFLTKGNTLKDELGEHFATSDEAKARADALNEEDVIDALDLSPELEKRLRRFKELATYHWSWSSKYGWVHHPGRYAVETYWEGSSSWSTEDDLAEVKREIERGDVERVVDLDTDTDVPFLRVVTVEIEA